MGEEGESSDSVSVVTSWFTPSYLFILVNLVIGTIAITSRFAYTRKRKPDSPSFGLGSYKHEEQETTEETQNQTVVEPTRIERVPSLLDRVKSINLGLYKTESTDHDDPTRKQLTRASKKAGAESEAGNMGGRGEEEGVDAKADDFIKRFKQQLRLERLDSILRYRDILQRK